MRIGTSFSPERRAESFVNDYSEELDKDLQTLKEKGLNDEKIEQYKTVFIKLISAWLSAKSRCLSSMIAGPSNFPVRRVEKANRSEQNKYNEFTTYRENVFKGVDQFERKQKIEAAGGELEVAKQKLISLEKNQEDMKAMNKAYKAFKKNPQSLIESGLSEAHQQIVMSFVPKYSFEPNPFPGFSLTNNNAKIKHTKQRIAELEQKEENAASGENKEIEIKGGVCVYDYSLDRITIKHNEKPVPEVIKELKSHGFKWSPFYKVWMRKITPNAIYVIEKLLLPKINAI